MVPIARRHHEDRTPLVYTRQDRNKLFLFRGEEPQMRFTRLGILGAPALLLALVQVSSVRPVDNTTERMAPRQFRPIQNLADNGDGTYTSYNWSGYAVTGKGFSYVKGSWVVPKATCTGVKGDQYAATWTGLDGWASTDAHVEQIGTDSDCVKTTPNYYAWYEFYPAGGFYILSVPVKPGDKMSAEVSYDASTATFYAKITDVTTGKSFIKGGKDTGATRTSAEWITEAPSSSSTGDILPMSDFGTVHNGVDSSGVASTDSAKDTAHTGAIGTFPAASIQLVNKITSTSSPETLTCSKLSTDHTSFSCKWGK